MVMTAEIVFMRGVDQKVPISHEPFTMHLQGQFLQYHSADTHASQLESQADYRRKVDSVDLDALVKF